MRLAACRITIYPSIEGPLSATTRPPTLSVDALPVDSGLEIHIDPAAIRVTGGGFSESDCRKIEASVREKCLETGRYPAIRFLGQAIETTPHLLRVEGTLHLHGTQKSLHLAFQRNGGEEYKASAVIPQSAFGIRPLTAFFGALRAGDEVRVEIAIRPASS
jgi:polyisoprenoid-binding protein YceI